MVDVPRPGDAALVQLVAPLGDVDAQTRDLRRRLAATGIVVTLLAGVLGYLLGRRATRSLSDLRSDADALDVDDPATWQVRDAYGAPEVDDVAGALNRSLSSLADESEQRSAALEAARAFASSATHELRTPLQSSLTNLDIARSPLADEAGRAASVELAHRQLQRMAAGLAAVRALADAEFADLSWFVPTDLSEVVDEAVADERRREGTAIEVTVDGCATIPLWRDGARLAIGNVVRNAIDHAGIDGGGRVAVTIRVDGATVTIDDDGPGIPRERSGTSALAVREGFGESGKWPRPRHREPGSGRPRRWRRDRRSARRRSPSRAPVRSRLTRRLDESSGHRTGSR